MENRLRNTYFALTKIILVILLLIYSLVLNTNTDIPFQGLLIALWLVLAGCLTSYELVNRPKVKILIGVFSIIITLSAIMWVDPIFYLFLPFTLLDIMGHFKVHPIMYPSILLGNMVYPHNQYVYIMLSIACICLYYQHYLIIKKYQFFLKDLANQELLLKNSMDKQSISHKNELEKFSLIYKNKRLQEKSKLSQDLHDKIGHSINGSIFQLEACKLLIDKNPEQSKKIVTEVILSLRNSMDEIREILRKEKPHTSEIELVHIKKFCAEFQAKYGIETSFICEGDIKTVPQTIWPLLLDNIIEAFSNALKYSRCHSMHIGIFIYNKFVRCTIKDDGNGCTNINEGMGISGMRDRIITLGGTLSINAELGFEIIMVIPTNHDSTMNKGV